MENECMLRGVGEPPKWGKGIPEEKFGVTACGNAMSNHHRWTVFGYESPQANHGGSPDSIPERAVDPCRG